MYKILLNYYTFTLFLFLFIPGKIFSQSVKGSVQDDENTPLPFVHVYVKHTDKGTITDQDGNYYLQLDEGDYEVVFSILGYETKTIPIVIYNKDQVKNISMESSSVQLEEIVIKAKRRDPAYEIIQNAIKAKKENNKQVFSSTCDVYIKAKEIITEKERMKRERESRRNEKEQDTAFVEDPVLAKRKEQEKLANSMNMAEIQLKRYYQYPDKVKEERNGYELRGNAEGLYFLSTATAEFNFYQNLMNIDNLNEVPLISPLHYTSVLSYKFKLENTRFEDGRKIYHIKVTPRKKGNATYEGYIDIIDGSFAIRSVDLSIHGGGLLYYDHFRIMQDHDLINDSVWIVTRQEFDYEAKAGRRNFKGSTIVRYENYELDVIFRKRFFRNELAVTIEEAYERDSSYWREVRPEPLTDEEKEIIRLKDSIEAAHNTREYLDSLDREYNRVTLGDALLWGIGHFNRDKKRHIWFSSLINLVAPFSIGGIRVGPDGFIYKRFKNEQSVFFFAQTRIGIRNMDLKGSIYTRYRYAPKKLADITLRMGRAFDMIQAYESFIGYMDRSNYAEATYLEVGHSYEVVNGLYFDVEGTIKENRPITDYEFGTLTDEIIENNEPRDFDPYQLLEGGLRIKYTFAQKYVTEPKRKIVLGSKWPTLSAYYKKGIFGVLGSDIDFDQVEISLYQNLKIGTMGTSTYKVMIGNFFNTDSMYYENLKIYPRGDNWFFSTPMQNQLMEKTISTDDMYFEAHYVHHFNGAIVNYIPFFRRLRIYTHAGMNYSWIRDADYHYFDFYFGPERTIRIQRQRFRLGLYFVFGGSAQRIRPTLQFSINYYDKREKSWGY